MPPGPVKVNKEQSGIERNAVKPRKRISLLQKMEVIAHSKETKCSVRQLAKIFGIGKTQASLILKEEEKLRTILHCEDNYPVHCKLRPNSVGFKIDRLVFDWYSEKKDYAQISKTMIRNKALKLAKEMGFDNFKASNGWLVKFLKRHKINFNSQPREDKFNNGGENASSFAPRFEIESDSNQINLSTEILCNDIKSNIDKQTKIANLIGIKSKSLKDTADLTYDEMKLTDVANEKYFTSSETNSMSVDGSEGTDVSSLDEWLDILIQILPKYSACNIFSIIQTGLFYKALPSNISELRGKRCTSGEFSTDRFTLLFCFSMSGIKEKPLVVANVEKGNFIKLDKSKVDCVADDNAWITEGAVTEWLEEIDYKMGKKKRKILLFLNHTIPRSDRQLKNVQVVYFPANLSNENEPVNHKIIQNFKMIYRQQLLKHLLKLKEEDENGVLPVPSISKSQSIIWISTAWKELAEYVIQKCFKDLGFYSFVRNATISDNETSASLSEISNLLCALDTEANAIDYVSIDSKLVTENDRFNPIETLVEEVAFGEEEIDNKSKKTAIDVNSYSEALQCLESLRKFYSSKNDFSSALLVKQLITDNGIAAGEEK